MALLAAQHQPHRHRRPRQSVWRHLKRRKALLHDSLFWTALLSWLHRCRNRRRRSFLECCRLNCSAVAPDYRGGYTIVFGVVHGVCTHKLHCARHSVPFAFQQHIRGCSQPLLQMNNLPGTYLPEFRKLRARSFAGFALLPLPPKNPPEELPPAVPTAGALPDSKKALPPSEAFGRS
jgi:hypothetical protein